MVVRTKRNRSESLARRGWRAAFTARFLGFTPEAGSTPPASRAVEIESRSLEFFAFAISDLSFDNSLTR